MSTEYYGSFDGSWSPQAILFNQLKCMAIGIVLFMIILWLISWIPLIGPWLKRAIQRLVTLLAEFMGVARCKGV